MSELRLNTDGHIIKFGADNDVSLTHVADAGLLLNSTMKLQFNDASQFVQGTSATVLSIGATDEIDLTATAVDLNGTLNVSGVATFQATPVFPDGSLALADLDIDGGTDIGAAIVDADLFIIDDGAGGTNRKVTASRLKTYTAGQVVQYVVATNSAAGTNGTTTFAATGLTLDITPTDANNRIVIHVQDAFKTTNDGSSNASGRTGVFALFKDSSILNDVSVEVGREEISSATSATPNALGSVVLIGTEIAGSTDERTYKLMCNTNGAAVVSFNHNGNDSFIQAWELKV